MIENGKDKIEWSRKVDESKVWLDLFISYIPISILSKMLVCCRLSQQNAHFHL